MSTFHVEVVADRTGKFIGNQMEYPTFDAARIAALDLSRRWLAVSRARVVGKDADGKVVSETEVM